MGMEVGGKKGGPMASMNVIPLIDILLVLIIIFMVITPLTPQGLQALVPQPTPPDASSSRTKTFLARRSSSRCSRIMYIKINEDTANWNTLGPRLNDIFKLRAEKVAFVKGDDTVTFGECRPGHRHHACLPGVDKVGLITARLEAGK